MNRSNQEDVLVPALLADQWSEPVPHAHAARVPASAKLLLSMLEQIRHGHLRLIHPNGFQQHFGNRALPAVSLKLASWSALRLLLAKGDIGFAEAYRDRLLDTNDLSGLLRLALQNRAILDRAIEGSWWGRAFYRLRHLFNANTRNGSKKNIHAHYDIGYAFYELWLDPGMTYSSAWFEGNFDLPLQAAQTAKYERILNLLQPQPGARILEIGCGWGGFAEAAARRGCSVHGITLSAEQLAFARTRMHNSGHTGQVDLAFLDYRDLHGQYDHIVSIEMLEAVGERYWPTYFSQVFSCLKPGGTAVIQTITIANERFDQYRQGTDFIQQYIFPGGMLPSPEQLSLHTNNAGLALEHLEDFGPDYAETLRRWRKAFDASLTEIVRQGFDDAFIRLWRFYLCYCEAAFDEAATGVVHLRVRKPVASDMPAPSGKRPATGAYRAASRVL